MPGPNFLATRHGTSIGQVFELRGSTIAEQIGANVSRHVSALSELQRAGPFAARLHGQLMGFFGNFDTTSGGIYRWDLDTQAWIRFYNFSARQRTDGLIDGGFCMVTGTNGHPYLISFGQDQFQVRYWLRVNSPTSVTGFFPAVNVTSGPGPLAFEWKNLAWASQRVNGTIYSYDPVSGIETIYAAPAPTTGSQLWTRFFSVDDRLFVVYEKASRDFASTVYEFSLGSFISTGVTIRYDRGLPSGGTQPGRGVASSTAFKHGDSAYVVAKGSDPAASSAADEGLGFYRFFVNTPGGALQVQELTAQIPVAIRRAGPSTLPDQQRYMVWSFVDDQTDPANPQPYVIFCPESDAETGATLFRLVMDGVTEWVNEVSLPTTSYFGYPDAFWGAGHFLNGKETTGSKLVTGEVWTTSKGSAGVQSRRRHRRPLRDQRDDHEQQRRVGDDRRDAPSNRGGPPLLRNWHVPERRHDHADNGNERWSERRPERTKFRGPGGQDGPLPLLPRRTKNTRCPLDRDLLARRRVEQPRRDRRRQRDPERDRRIRRQQPGLRPNTRRCRVGFPV
jgi:hypothetical protein